MFLVEAGNFLNKMVLFRRNTTIAYNYQHPDVATRFGLF